MGPFCLCSALPVVCFVAGIYNVFPSFIEDVMRLADEIEKTKNLVRVRGAPYIGR